MKSSWWKFSETDIYQGFVGVIIFVILCRTLFLCLVFSFWFQTSFNISMCFNILLRVNIIVDHGAKNDGWSLYEFLGIITVGRNYCSSRSLLCDTFKCVCIHLTALLEAYCMQINMHSIKKFFLWTIKES